MKQPPCYQCEQRHELCHMTCERYLDFKAECKRINDARSKMLELDNYHTNSVIAVKKRLSKRHHSILV